MREETPERHSQVGAIKKEARSDNGGRSYLLQGLWACRLAAGLSQKELAQMIGGGIFICCYLSPLLLVLLRNYAIL
jgi:hypothetical protein